jgi:polyribonucleotide nucleotidyltransferase
LDAKKARVEELKEMNKALERDREKMEQREEHLKKVDLCTKRCE